MKRILITLSLILAVVHSTTFQDVYPRANKAKNLPPTSTNPNFNYVVSQPVNKQEIGLNYEAEFYSGYIPVDNQGSYIFYHVYPSNGANNANANLENNDPLILWMQGGPGCSDWIGAMIEHGPFTIIMNSEGQPVPVLTNINWNQGYNLLYVDQPPGVGFSPVGSGVNIENSNQAAEYMQTFLVGFFNAYPSLKNNAFYIFGESYAGHWIPALASLLVSNKANNGITLSGIAIGDGIVNPYYHAMAWYQAGYSVGIIDTKVANFLNSEGLQAQADFNNGNFSGVAVVFDNIMAVLTDTPMTGVTDIDDYRESEGEFAYEPWMALPSMRSAFAVDPSVQYEDCNEEIYEHFFNDIGNSFANNVTYLLNENIPVLIYNGQDDMCIPIAGTRGWLDNLSWGSDKPWVLASTQAYTNQNEEVIGTWKQYKDLTFIVMDKAGHMVPHWQPANAKQMVDDFIGGSFNSQENDYL